VSHRIVNILFHGIGKAPRRLTLGEAELWVETGSFRTLLGTARARDDVRISFDDGNRSDFEIALPTLLELDLTASFFIVAARLEVPGFVTRDDVRNLADAGMAIGLHGFTHQSWRGLDDHGLRRELIDAKIVLEDVSGRRVTAAACPFGAYDRRVLRALRKAGYEQVFTSDGGAADPDAWLQPRYSVSRTDEQGLIDRLFADDRSQRTRLLLRAKRTIKRFR
jgi:peptidoglycan/xylan/chitin deacetylase (PgdA/CDA1 family)